MFRLLVMGLFYLSLLVSIGLIQTGTDPIRFPPVTPPVVPVPVVDPVAPISLPAEYLYVVDSDVELMVGAYPSGLLSASKETGPIRIRGKFLGGNGTVETRSYKGKCIVIVEAVGTGTASLVVVPLGAKSKADWVVKVIAANHGPRPPPLPPLPPVPPPDPPTPVDPAPISAPGFRVLMVCETSDGTKIPPAQLSILTSTEIRSYLNRKCVVGPDGTTTEYRIWDKDVDTVNESKIWQEAMKRPRKSIPWILISDGKKGFEGPLPATIKETLDLLKKYGGE